MANFRLLTALLILLLAIHLRGQIPPGYYAGAEGKTGVELQSALHNIIKDHTKASYSSLYAHFKTTDVKTGNVVWDMYSDVPGGSPAYVYHYSSGDECGNYNGEGDCYNREHSWPNSWFGGENYPMYSDLFHLYPTDGYVNNRRSNYPFGEVGAATWTSTNGSKVGSCSTSGYSGTVFEPIDEYKGDFARTYFYMSTRYYTQDSGWPGSPQTVGSQLKPWALAMMLGWHSQDPVSVKEVDRNNRVYGIQDNRNPYIDHPEYANLIWGYPVGLEDPLNAPALTSLYPNPAGDACYLQLSTGSKESGYTVNIVSLTGISYPVSYTEEDNQLRILLHGVPAGIYVVALTGQTTRNTLFAKLVKR